MDKEQICQEKIGLFLVSNCSLPVAGVCENCGKSVCKNHIFDYISGNKQSKLCLSCKAALDPRLTSEIELYSPERIIWRKKMMNRFQQEYPFLAPLADQYGTLFDTILLSDFNNTSEDSSSSFDS